MWSWQVVRCMVPFVQWMHFKYSSPSPHTNWPPPPLGHCFARHCPSISPHHHPRHSPSPPSTSTRTSAPCSPPSFVELQFAINGGTYTTVSSPSVASFAGVVAMVEVDADFARRRTPRLSKGGSTVVSLLNPKHSPMRMVAWCCVAAGSTLGESTTGSTGWARSGKSIVRRGVGWRWWSEKGLSSAFKAMSKMYPLDKRCIMHHTTFQLYINYT